MHSFTVIKNQLKNFTTKAGRPYLDYLLLLVGVYLIFLLKIGSFPMRWWDESMFAVNTYEMLENKHYFSLYYGGNADLFNTKPPLLNWLQLFFMKIFGYNELAMRLPSGLAAGACVLLVFQFLQSYFDRLVAWAAALVLLSSFGFIGFHTARTGDSDALVSLFILLTNFAFIRFLISHKQRHIYWFFCWFTLAFAAKLYVVFLFIPAYLFTLIITKKISLLLHNKKGYLAGAISLLTMLFLIILREWDTPGYVSEILFKDVGRIVVEVEGHHERFLFYWSNFFKEQYNFWIILMLLGMLQAFSTRINPNHKLILQSIIAFIISYFLIISISTTKLYWYDMPLYPFMAITAGVGISVLIKRGLGSLKRKAIIIPLVMLVIFIQPVYASFNRSQSNNIPVWDQKAMGIEFFMFKAIKKHKNLDQTKVYYSGWNGSLLFYKYQLKELGQDISLHKKVSEFKVGDQVLVGNDSLSIFLNDRFDTELLVQGDYANLYKLVQENQP